MDICMPITRLDEPTQMFDVKGLSQSIRRRRSESSSTCSTRFERHISSNKIGPAAAKWLPSIAKFLGESEDVDPIPGTNTFR
jgi:hypothetical protein